MSGRHLFSSLFVIASLAACGSPAVVMDDAAVLPDAYLVPSHLLGRCTQDSQCPGVGAYCRTSDHGYPEGQCDNPCTDRTDCDDGSEYNECLMMTGASAMACEAYCRNGSDCRPGYTCEVLSTDASGAIRGICIPACATDDECGGTSQCDTYTGRCVAAGMVGTMGGLTGDACTSAGGCRSGNCRLPIETMNYTGYLGGYCESVCRIPVGYNTNNFFDGPALPQGTCTGNAVCIPGGNEYGAGDLGVCLLQCTGDSDCRAGYSCVQTAGASSFTNGYCAPLDCTMAACPSGTTCHQAQNAQGTVVGICG